MTSSHLREPAGEWLGGIIISIRWSGRWRWKCMVETANWRYTNTPIVNAHTSKSRLHHDLPLLCTLFILPTRCITNFNKWKILRTCKQTVLRSCAQHIRVFLNKWKIRSNNGHTCYTCKEISRLAARTQTKYRRRCRLSNKQTIYRLLHPSPGAEIHGASQPLPSNGRLCISQKNPATPTRPSVRPSDVRYSRCNQRPLRTMINRSTLETTWKLLELLYNLPRIILIDWLILGWFNISLPITC